MKEREIEIFTDLLLKNKPKKVLEYGCGYSTIYYPKFLPEGARWIAVEHNKMWSDNVKKGINNGNTVIYCIPPDIEPYEKDGFEKDFTSYIKKGAEGAPYDLILVDGMAREVCIDRAYDMLTDDGLLVVHDANRVHYRDAMKKFPYVLILEDFRRSSGGMALLPKSHPISHYIDIENYTDSWKKGAFWGNFFKFKYLMGKPSKPFRMIESLD